VFLVSDSFRDLTGDIEEYSLMANVLYDIALSKRLSLSLGAGVGADNVRFDGTYTSFGGPVPASDDEWKFAAQGIAGIAYSLSPRLDLTLTYRYLHISDPTFSQAGSFSVFSLSQTVQFDNFGKHSLSAGLRFDLYPDEAPAAPPAPPLPPPPPPPAVKQFIVFFGFDRCDITDEADRVLGEAASASKSTGSASVRIVGHTDTSGSPTYNQRLSECRANAAKTNLVGRGIDAGAISTAGRGEADLMVQTGDGVKEPQNRRATVDLQ
jgi:outer membrane protein OmpA-like peptidoglycan-associated protein